MEVPFFQNKKLYLEQFAHYVVDFTSKYNNSFSLAYGPDNLIGANTQYPNYGDFEDTYSLRAQWKDSKGRQKPYMTHDVEDIETEDYVIVRFEQAVCPTSVYIYETYNPGSVFRLWGRGTQSVLSISTGKWHLLYEGKPQICPKRAKKFCPPLNPIADTINELRLDFNQSLLNYHTSIDAVHLAGYILQSKFQLTMYLGFLNKLEPKSKPIQKTDVNDCKNVINFIPNEVLFNIVKYLDFKSLARSSRVCKRWWEICNQASLFYNISLRKYWYNISDSTLDYFLKRCTFVKKLDLTGCNNDTLTEAAVINFLELCGQQIAYLALNNCHFVTEKTMQVIGNCTELIDLRLRSIGLRDPMSFIWFYHIVLLKQLTALDLCYTHIRNDVLIAILRENPNLLHLHLESCTELRPFDDITRILAAHNRQLVTLCAWKTISLTAEGVRNLAQLSHLEELDMGWCMVMTDPAGSLDWLAQGCPHLRRLVLSGWRGISDHSLLPIIRSCKSLNYLDLLGITNISEDIIDIILDSLPDLQVFDISFCLSLPEEQIAVWRSSFPHVAIYRSCERSGQIYENMDDIDK